MKTLSATVVSAKNTLKTKTIVVGIKRRLWCSKYRRYYYTVKNLNVFSPVPYPVGTTVTILKTKLISPTKAHLVVQ